MKNDTWTCLNKDCHYYFLDEVFLKNSQKVHDENDGYCDKLEKRIKSDEHPCDPKVKT